jgi:hypothetical protein
MPVTWLGRQPNGCNMGAELFEMSWVRAIVLFSPTWPGRFATMDTPMFVKRDVGEAPYRTWTTASSLSWTG